jgi:hypothetical protein
MEDLVGGSRKFEEKRRQVLERHVPLIPRPRDTSERFREFLALRRARKAIPTVEDVRERNSNAYDRIRIRLPVNDPLLSAARDAIRVFTELLGHLRNGDWNA